MTDADINTRPKFDLTAVNRSVGMNEDAIAMFNSEHGGGVIQSTMMMSGLTNRDEVTSANNYAQTSNKKK
jgi:predicted ABC-type transport system involved in lysophospholipase L1 biosynthesis ATPase subunit